MSDRSFSTARRAFSSATSRSRRTASAFERSSSSCKPASACRRSRSCFASSSPACRRSESISCSTRFASNSSSFSVSSSSAALRAISVRLLLVQRQPLRLLFELVPAAPSRPARGRSAPDQWRRGARPGRARPPTPPAARSLLALRPERLLKVLPQPRRADDRLLDLHRDDLQPQPRQVAGRSRCPRPAVAAAASAPR